MMNKMTVKKNSLITSSITLFKSRKEIIFAVTWASSLASIIAGRGFPPITKSIISLIATMMIIASVYIYNDIIDRYMDAGSDQEKKKARPISNGTVSIKHAKIFVIITGIIGLGTSLMLNLTAFGVGLTYYVLVFLYSYPKVRFKENWLLKNLVTAFLMPTAFLIAGTAVEHTISTNMMLLSVSFYVLTVFTQPAIADMLDYEEDLSFNVKTIGNTLSWKQNLVLYNIGILTLLVYTIASYFMFGYHIIAPLVTTALCAYLLYYSYSIREESGLTASYKLRPISYSLILLNPLLLAIGALI